MLNRMPWAPVMLISSSGLAIAWRAASTARFSPVARPMPMSAEPASFMIARTSAKSRLMRPGTVMMSLMPWTPWRRTSSTTRKASRMRRVLLDDVLEPVVRDRDERVDLGLELLGRLLGDELAACCPRSANGLVTTPMVSAPSFLGDLRDDRRGARTGAAAEAGGDEDHVRVREGLGDLLASPPRPSAGRCPGRRRRRGRG